MSALLPIIQAAIEEGSSGTGNSYYKGVASCGRQARLNRERALAWKEAEKLPFDFASLEDDESGMTLGKVFHGFAHVYFGKRTGADFATEVTDINMGDAVADAKRLFLAYSKRFSPDDFAEVIESEQPYPRNDTEQELLDYYVGAPYTFRPDMVVRLEERHCKIMQEKRNLHGLLPGRYLWDFKTGKTKTQYEELLWRSDPQFRGYMACYNYLHPNEKEPLQGMIADRIINYKKAEKLEADGFFSVYVPFPTERQIDGWRKWIRSNYERSINAPDDFNLSACFNYHKPCAYLTSGACDQT